MKYHGYIGIKFRDGTLAAVRWQRGEDADAAVMRAVRKHIGLASPDNVTAYCDQWRSTACAYDLARQAKEIAARISMPK